MSSDDDSSKDEAPEADETEPTAEAEAPEPTAEAAAPEPTAEAEEPEPTPEAGGFAAFGLDERIIRQLDVMGFEKPTPIQSATISKLLEGQDLIGRARTGSGKTAAFGLPLLEMIKEGGSKPRALVLSPTRELAKQIGEALAVHGKNLQRVRGVTIYGGSPYPPQIKALKRGCSVVVGTPGRVIDLMEGGSLDLSQLELFVLDEADEMLRMGFIDDVEKLLSKTPEGRQVVLFSATMPTQIRKVASRYLKDPAVIQVEDKALSVGHIAQRWVTSPSRNKLEALQRILRGEERGTTLVFARTRASCSDVADALRRGGYTADSLHGDLSQAARERVLRKLRSGELKLLVATDVAARGLDVGHITHVINLDLPESKEVYVHRIGRTGRAGRDGNAISIATPAQHRFMHSLQHALGVEIKLMEIPSDAQIIDRRRGELADKLGGELDALEHAQLWLDELQEQRGWTPEETARRALRLLASKSGVSLSPLSDCETDPPAWSRPKNRGNRSQRSERPRQGGPERPSQGGRERRQHDGEMIQLYIAVGRRHGTRPQDLVGALAGETGIPGAAIGAIHIADGASFVDLPADMAKHIVGRFDKIEVRGIAASVDLSKTSPPGQGRSQRQGRGQPFPYGQGGGGGGQRPAFRRKFGGGASDRKGFSKGRRTGKVRSKK